MAGNGCTQRELRGAVFSNANFPVPSPGGFQFFSFVKECSGERLPLENCRHLEVAGALHGAYLQSNLQVISFVRVPEFSQYLCYFPYMSTVASGTPLVRVYECSYLVIQKKMHLILK